MTFSRNLDESKMMTNGIDKTTYITTHYNNKPIVW